MTSEKFSGQKSMLSHHERAGPRQNLLALLLFALSGLTGLVYEVLWRRMLSVVLGGSIYATAAVLSSFMAGLFLGSVVVGRWADRWKNPLRAYGLFEILIAAFALVLHPASRGLISLQSHLYPSLESNPLALGVVRFATSFGILLFPAFLMGGTFPLLSKFYLRDSSSVGKGIGRLYSVNTGGAVLGTVLAGFFLIRLLGTRATNLAAIALNAAVGIAAVGLSSGKFIKPPSAVSPTTSVLKTYSRATRAALLTGFALSGFTALCYEVLWSRVLVFVVGNTTYSFAIMLSTFLLGLTLGSYLFALLLARKKNLFMSAAVIELLIGIFALVGMALTRSFYGIFDNLKGSFSTWGYVPYTVVRYALASMALLPQAILFGLFFPALVSIYTGNYEKVGGDVGRAYGSNTVGAIFGSAAAVFLLIPAFGLSGAMLVTAVVNVSIGLVLLGLSPELSSRKKSVSALVAVVVFACAVVGLPPRIDIGTSSEGLEGERGELVFYREGASGTVAVFLDAEQGLKMMQIDGQPQVPTDLDAMQAFRLLGHLPFFMHPNPKDVLVTAFGGGITTGAILTHPVERVDAVEICPSVFEAAKLFEQENNGALSDPRLRLIVDDANNYVKVTDHTYDVIASDATHPAAFESWVLYTRDFYSACRSLLREGGVMCQWVPLHGLPTSDLKIILRTFQDVFPHASLWFARGYAVMLGTPKRLVLDAGRINEVLQANNKASADLRRVHLESVPAILKNLVLDEEDVRRFAGDSPIATEDNSPLAFAEKRAFGRRTIPENAAALAGAVTDTFPTVVGAGESEEKAILAAARVRRPYLNAVRSWDERNPVEGLRYLEEAFAVSLEDADLAWYLRWMTILSFARYRKEEDLGKAITDFRRWAEVFPRSPWTRIALGHFLMDKGRLDENAGLVDEGIAELRRAGELASGDPFALEEVSHALLSAGKDEQAISFLEKYREAIPDDVENWRNLVGAYVRTDKYDKAIPLLERIAEHYSEDPTSWSSLAGAYEAVERYADARRAILKALRLDPHNPTFQLALDRLEELEGGRRPSGDTGVKGERTSSEISPP